MNHLAHALLGAADDDLMLGNLIADFLRGTVDPALPPRVRAGIALHRAVDRFTDAHPQVVAARRLFDAPFRRYAGILLDIWFDHLLARDWTRHADGSLHAFSMRVQSLLQARVAELPDRMRGFARYLQDNDLPEDYRETAMIERVLIGMSHRLSRANPLAEAMPVLQGLAIPLHAHFSAFFPDLRAFATRESTQLLANAAS